MEARYVSTIITINPQPESFSRTIGFVSVKANRAKILLANRNFFWQNAPIIFTRFATSFRYAYSIAAITLSARGRCRAGSSGN
jgi:hypothetical protein